MNIFGIFQRFVVQMKVSIHNVNELKKKREKFLIPFNTLSTCFSVLFFFLSSNYYAVDTASAIAIALMTFGTMYPMSVYSGKVLLQVRQCCKTIFFYLFVSFLLNVLVCSKDVYERYSKENI